MEVSFSTCELKPDTEEEEEEEEEEMEMARPEEDDADEEEDDDAAAEAGEAGPPLEVGATVASHKLRLCVHPASRCC